MKRFINYAYCFSFALAMSVPMVASAQVPQTMSYQAALTDNTGNAVADGVYDLAFSLYDSAVDGTTLWTEAQQVEIQNGLLHVLLGSVNPLALAFDKPYWLGISVGGEAEMEPRIALSSAPYALAAAQKILEPEAGDGFVIKNSEGQVAHHLASDGTAIHAGEVSAQAFHVVVDGDTLISFNADGTSYHSGLEEYAGGFLVREELLVTG